MGDLFEDNKRLAKLRARNEQTTKGKDNASPTGEGVVELTDANAKTADATGAHARHIPLLYPEGELLGLKLTREDI